ncbi:response regulator transcription factor [Microbacterium keratanolyticum]
MRSLVEYALTSQGFVVETAADPAQAWQMLLNRTYDVVILDVVMPGASGTALCARIRESLDIPVIMLTALTDVEQRVVGLEAGADDYVAKPFNPRELALRALALYRRTHRPPATAIENGPLVIDPSLRRVLYYGSEVHLSESEFRLCLSLAEQAGRPLSHAELITVVWGSDDALGGREMLKTTVWRLRLLLTQVNPVPILETVRGVGYRTLRLIDGRPAPVDQ